MILFLYRYYLCYFTEDTKKALQDTLDLNSEFIHPLRENEVIRATRSAETVFKNKDKMYKYKNDTLIDLLDISEEEQMHLLTIISKKELKRRNNEYNKQKYAKNKEHISKVKKQKYKEKQPYIKKLKEEGKMTKQEELTILRQKIKDLKEKGLANKVIAIDLNIPIKTLERHITFMKKTKLLQ